MLNHKCKTCNNIKPLERFPKDKRLKSGHRNICKDCNSKRFMKWKLESGFLDYQKEHYNKNYENIKSQMDAYRAQNRDKLNKNQRLRRQFDINFKLRQILRNRIYSAIRVNRPGSSVKDLGCSISKLKSHLESQFKPGMTWENHGKWHIDHIKPLASFDLLNRDEFKKACHYSNLQPLWARDNIIKSNKTSQ